MADARRKKVIVFNKDDLRRGADDIRREFENIKSSGKSSARGVQEAFESLGKRAKTALSEAFDGNSFKGLKDIEESLKIQRKAVDDLTEQYKKAKAEFDSVNLGTQDERLIAKREKASALYRQVSAELKGEEELLKKQEEAFKLISTELQTAGDKSVTFYTQMRQIREEMNKLALAGKDQTPEYDRLRSKLDEVSVAYRKVQQEQQMLAKYGNMLIPGLIQGMSGLAGAFSVYQGVSSLFIKDNEKLAEVQTKLQSAMALTIGLQQVQQTLHSTSAFRMGVVRKATQAWTTAQKALNTSLGVSKGLAGALATGGIMALVGGVIYLVSKYKEWSSEQEKLYERQKKLSDISSKGTQNAQKELVHLNLLYNAAKNNNKTQEERIKAAKELQRLYPDYLGSLSQEEILTGKAADAHSKLADSILEVARARAIEDSLVDNYKKIVELESKIALEESKIEEERKKGVRDATSVLQDTRFDRRSASELADERAKTKLNALKPLRDEIKEYKSLNNELEGSIKTENIIDDTKEGERLTSTKENIVSLLDDIEKTKREIAKQGIDDRLELLKLEEEYELESLNKRLENAKYSEEEKQSLILLVQRLYELKREQITTEEQRKQQDEINKSLEAYTSYEVKRNQITEKYAKLRENAKGNKNIDSSLIDAEEQEALNKVDEFLVSRQDEFIKWSEGVIGLSLQQLRVALVEAQKELERIEFLKGKDSKEAGIVRQKVVKLETTINDTESSPNGKTLKQWQDLDRVLNDTSRSFKEMESAIGGTIGEIVSSAGELATATVGMISSISSLANNSVTAVQGTATAAATAISTAEKASVILAAISAGMQIIATVTKMFRKQNKEEKDTQRLQAATTRISNTNAVINKLIEKRIDLINKATAAEMKYNETLTQAALNTQKGFIEDEFRRLGGNDFFGRKGKNNNLTLRDLGITDMDKLSEFWDSEDRLKLLQNGYDQRNKDEWQQIIDAYRALIDAEEQLTVAKKESLTGMSLEDAQSGLDEFIKDAEKGFNDVAKSFEDTMSNAMLNLIKKQYMNEALEAWYDDFAKAMDDDSLSDAEVEALRDQYYAIYEEGKKRLDSMKEVIGGDSSMNQQSSVGVTKTASQDSIDVLDGRLTHVQETNQEISNNSAATLELMRTNFAMLNERMETNRGITLQSMYHLADIVNNTNVLPGMAKDIAEVKRNTKGL